MKIQLDRDNFFVKFLPVGKKKEEVTKGGIIMAETVQGAKRQYQIAEILETSDAEKYPVGTHVIVGTDVPASFEISAEGFTSPEYKEIPLSKIRGRILDWK